MFEISDNRKEKCSTLTTLGLEAFKVFMACMLSLFVSQKCYDHDCNVSEKFSDSSASNVGVLVMNFFTLSVFIVGYVIEYFREQYIIHHFNNNPKLSDHNIIKIISKAPIVEKNLMKWNKRFYYITSFSVVIGILNFIVSGLYIYYEHYNGTRTLTSLLTNILLVSNTVSSNYKISSKSYKKVFALSSSRSEPISYNDFDDNIKHSIQEENENLVSENTEAENVEGDESSDSENKDKKVVPSSSQQEGNNIENENENIEENVKDKEANQDGENIEKNEEVTPEEINPKIN